MRTFWRKGLALAALGMVAGACQELTVPNLNNPERERALKQPADVEAIIAGTYKTAWQVWNANTEPSLALSAMADEMTTTAANFGAWTLSSEPRIAWDNNPTYTYASVAESPWYTIYDGLANIHDGVEAIKVKGIKIDSAGVDRSDRAILFGKFTEGILRGYLALLFDKAFVPTEATVLSVKDSALKMPALPYKEVMDSAIASFDLAIQMAQAQPATIRIPRAWLYQSSDLTMQQFIRLVNTYKARYMALVARSPQERQSVDWDKVIAAASAGITADFGPIGGTGTGLSQSNYKLYSMNNWGATAIVYHADYKLIGPADVSGKYQVWLNTPLEQRDKFYITTPDRRITGTDSTKDGTYFRYRAPNVNNFRQDRGTYHHSWYQFWRFKREYGQNTNVSLINLTVAELDLLRAEALYRKGDVASLAQAVTLINKTREANGQLPPVTVTGVPNAPNCVPRKANGACGDLWDALVYEKRIETAGTDPIAFFDARGWGNLVKNTPIHFPIPGRELAVYKMPMYTFGGGLEGSAP
jgi:hypothetical protein